MAEDSQIDEESEREILEGFLSGSERGVRTFLEEYSGFILKAISSVRIKDNSLTSDDLFGNCIELLLRDNMRGVRLFKKKSRFSTYLFTICRRYAIKIVNRSSLPLPPAPDTLESPSALAEEFSEKEILLLERARLLCKPNEQIFITMMFYDERSTREIMEFFGWNSENTVYSQKNKIITKLKKIIKRLFNGNNE
jgi:RNA polymerase sigma factor (sigma-70 family)